MFLEGTKVLRYESVPAGNMAGGPSHPPGGETCLRVSASLRLLALDQVMADL